MNDSNSSFLAGVVIGGLVGVAIALVFAPQKGSSARASFGNRAVSLNRSINQTTTDTAHADAHGFAAATDEVRRGYEPPRIILDEGTGASAPPTNE